MATGASRAWSLKAAKSKSGSPAPQRPQPLKDKKCRCGCSRVQGMWVPVGRLPVTNSILVHFMWKECALVGSGLDGQGDPETLLTSILP